MLIFGYAFQLNAFKNLTCQRFNSCFVFNAKYKLLNIKYKSYKRKYTYMPSRVFLQPYGHFSSSVIQNIENLTYLHYYTHRQNIINNECK